jgi:hypothetical protein
MPRQFSRLVGTQLGKLIFFGSEANIAERNWDVRFVPKADIAKLPELLRKP